MGCGGSKGAASGGVGSSPPGELTLLVIGLDNSGKSTLMGALANDVDPFVTPTVGASPTRKTMKGLNLEFFDVGGGGSIRGIWPSYFAQVHGIIYVVDAADEARLEESATVLKGSLEHKMVQGKPLLV